RELDDFVALIVMTKDDDAPSERGFGGGDARVHLLVAQTQIAVGQRLTLANVVFLVLGQDGKQHGLGGACAACEIFLNLRSRKSRAARTRSAADSASLIIASGRLA